MIKVADVFKIVGTPTYTYVEQDNGFFEKNLKSGILANGTICLLTGPSKTGKTSLYNKVLKDLNLEPLIVRCDSEVTVAEFWKKALEKIKFERVQSKEILTGSTKKADIKTGAEFGWKWLAKVLGEVNLGIENEKSETQIRELIISNPSPDHLIPVLKELNLFLVAEDFHYLKPEVQKIIFQQWKTFVDEEVSALVVGTTHHAVDIALANNDLSGRIVHIEMGIWKKQDLEQIITKGFNTLNMDISENMSNLIIDEATGLPIIVQSVCLQHFIDKNVIKINNTSKRLDIPLTKESVLQSLHNVATMRYSTYSTFFEILSAGLRANKYDTYKLVLTTFSLDPPQFFLTRNEIDTRLLTVIKDTTKLPPPNSISSMLRSISQLQQKKQLELLEWSEIQNKLFILEPAFLFYIRWKEKRTTPVKYEDLFELVRKMFLEKKISTNISIDVVR
jgi:archaellum biogenesis ATPase FlaH